MKKAIRLACMAIVAWYAMPALAQTSDPANKAATPYAANASDYVLGSDDQLHITVWKEPDFTVTLPVRPDGKISPPLINDIPAAGLTPTELKIRSPRKIGR